MKKYLFVATLLASTAFAASTHNDKELKEDINRHRAMAAAHEGDRKSVV